MKLTEEKRFFLSRQGSYGHEKRRFLAICNTASQHPGRTSAVIDDTLPITVEAPEACPRYLGRVVKVINVKAPTPLWMKEKLRRCGIRSIDAVVDVTNYVLLELGQPMLSMR